MTALARPALDASDATRRDAAAVLNVAAKVALGGLLAHVALFPDLAQYRAKGMGYRMVLYPAAMAVVPALRLLRRRPGVAYPHLVDALLVAPFLFDMAGNTADLYDTVAWWDDAMHVATWAPLVAAFGLAIRSRVDQPWIHAGLVVGFGAVTTIAWEIAEYVTFVVDHPTESLSAYRDTVGDLAGSVTGSILSAIGLAASRRRSTLS